MDGTVPSSKNLFDSAVLKLEKLLSLCLYVGHSVNWKDRQSVGCLVGFGGEREGGSNIL